MKRVKTACWLAALALIGGAGVTRGFEVEEYRDFLERHADMSAAELEAMYPAGVFEQHAPADFAAAAYSDSVDFHLRLTEGEKELIGWHGFVVTERIRPPSFGSGFLDIYHMDLPVFVSTDAILHALHMSYDAILIDLERGLLRPRLERLLEELHEELRELAQLADPVEGMAPVWEDVDLYLTVPRRLLGQEVDPVFAGNREAVGMVLARIVEQVPAELPLFGAGRWVDFSQFKPRGHYTDSPELTEYFQAMIWLGRVELYLRPPQGVVPPVPIEAVRRQAALAAMVAPPAERGGLPAFMRTGAWWQEKMNTQMAAWTQLRHDNLLYAKQSYTAGAVCSYPEGYVEPIPGFYRAVRELAQGTAGRLGELLDEDDYRREWIGGYFREMAAIADTLEGIARKELGGEELSAAERGFLQTVLYDVPEGCVPVYRGWYARLFYTGEEGFFKQDLVVADVHTQPTDAGGSMVGHVLHAGTGPVNMAVLVAETCGGMSTVFAGPVMSYYEHVSLNFKRLTDEEWYLMHAQEPSFRPDFVRSYLADEEGRRQVQGSALPTAVEEETADMLPEEPGLALWPGYPNPFNASTLIRFSVGPEMAGERVTLTVYNASGQVVRRLVDRILPAENYSVRWEGTADGGEPVASGAYTYLLKAGESRLSGRVSLVK